MEPETQKVLKNAQQMYKYVATYSLENVIPWITMIDSRQQYCGQWSWMVALSKMTAITIPCI